MFDSTVIRTGPSHMTVSEHRAPTDDSVRILRELEDRAMQGILKVVEVKNNLFEGKAIFMRHSPLQEVQLVAMFMLNGKKFTVKSSVSEMEYLMHGEAKALEAIVDGLVNGMIKEMRDSIVEVP